MKTATALIAAFALGFARSCTPLPEPPRAPLLTRAVMVRDTSGERYHQEQQRLVAAWQWYGGN